MGATPTLGRQLTSSLAHTTQATGDTARPFSDRHIGPRADDAQAMLAELGYDSLEALSSAAVPESIQNEELNLPAGRSEFDVLNDLRELAGQNVMRTQLIGQGYYDTITPAVIRRNLVENPAWYTAYTPYQPEISQGRLEALLNFQQVVQDLTGLDIANASLLDEATAVAEAVLLMRRAVKKGQPLSSTPNSTRRPSPSSVPAPRLWTSASPSPTSPRDS